MSSWRSLLQEAGEKLFVITNFACFYNVFTKYVMDTTQCMGPSMLPTFNASGDVFLIEHWSTRFDGVKVGDVVVSRSPLNPKVVVCKRILGLEGEKITVVPNAHERNQHVRQVIVPKGHVWLQGDNFLNSTDSRNYGPVPYALIQGKVFYKIWPLWESGPVQSHRAKNEFQF